MNLPLFCIYLAAAAIHLFFCLCCPESLLCKLTKCLMMPLLLVWYLASAEVVSCWVIAALLLGWAGDACLLFPSRKACFLAGLSAFLAGHLCYAAAILLRLWQRMLPAGGLQENPTPLLIAGAGFALAFLFIGIAAYLTLRRHVDKSMKGPVIAYLLVILCMAALAGVYSFPFQNGFGENGIFFGALLFVLSDYLLARGMFIGEQRGGAFAVMLTYLSAQLLLCYGLAGALPIPG